jgi:aryl-alcohol dehydrogenase-like predicted oxidoreductase
VIATPAFSVVGLGTGPLGEASMSAAEADRLVHAALDLGVTVFDTARSYGASEQRLGRALGSRRREVHLVTKGGYGIDGVADWTGEVIRRGVDEALGRLGTDVIDVFLLHSCDVGVLERGDVVEALLRAREAGKIRMTGYSGEGDALAWAAARRETFSALECSVSPFDQRNLALVAAARAESFCVLAKRPLGNAPWRFGSRPGREDIGTYWDRYRAMGVDPSPLSWESLAVRFAAFQAGVTTILVGTSRVEHLGAAVRAAAEGALGEEQSGALRAAFEAHGAAWGGVI